MPQRKYYDAYNDRYRQVHEQNLQWFDENPSPIVAETIRNFSISRRHKLLEIGCGEGRDAYPLLAQGFDLLATDVSLEAISFCQRECLISQSISDFLTVSLKSWTVHLISLLQTPLAEWSIFIPLKKNSSETVLL